MFGGSILAAFSTATRCCGERRGWAARPRLFSGNCQLVRYAPGGGTGFSRSMGGEDLGRSNESFLAGSPLPRGIIAEGFTHAVLTHPQRRKAVLWRDSFLITRTGRTRFAALWNRLPRISPPRLRRKVTRLFAAILLSGPRDPQGGPFRIHRPVGLVPTIELSLGCAGVRYGSRHRIFSNATSGTSSPGATTPVSTNILAAYLFFLLRSKIGSASHNLAQ